MNDRSKQYLKHAIAGTDYIYKVVGRWLFKLYLQSRAWGSDGKLLEVGSFALELVGGDRLYFQTTVAPIEGSNFLRQIFIDLFRIYLLFCLLNCWTYMTLGAF